MNSFVTKNEQEMAALKTEALQLLAKLEQVTLNQLRTTHSTS